MTRKRSITVFGAWGLLVLSLLILTANGARSQGIEEEPPTFMKPVVDGLGQANKAGDFELRSQVVLVDTDLLGQARGQGTLRGHSLSLHLFNGEILTAVPREVRSEMPDRLIWHGKVMGYPESDLTFSVRDGIIAGNIGLRDRLYKISYLEGNRYLLQERWPQEPKPELPPVEVNLPDMPGGPVAAMVGGEDGTVIDVMVLYTPAARSTEGGYWAMAALIDLAIEETNQAFRNSKIDTRLRLVFSSEVSYTETGNLGTDLARLRLANDNYMDQIQSWRNTYEADLVSLIVDRGNGCGVAYVMAALNPAFEEYAFSVIHRDCATGYYSFGHEIAHNLGSHHNRDSEPPPGNALADFSYGYHPGDQSFRTVMSYDCPGGCSRVPYYSNPDVDYLGRVTGIDYGLDPYHAADNARSINMARQTAANWRTPAESLAPPEAPAKLTARVASTFSIELSWNSPQGTVSGIRIERSEDGRNWATQSQMKGTADRYVDEALRPGHQYYYRVYAYNAGGNSPYSNTAAAVTGPAAQVIYFPLTEIN